MQIKDYMSGSPVTANLRDGLHQTFHRMLERNVRHMPVLGPNERLVGIISERDIRRPDFVDSSPSVANYYALDNHITVQEAMTANPQTVTPDTSVTHAVKLLVDKRYGALPVVDDAGKLVGIVSVIDLLRAFLDSLPSA